MKKLLFILMAVVCSCPLMAINVWDGTSEPWTHGSGTENDPYLIETAAHLAYLAEQVNEGYQALGHSVFAHTYFLMTDDFDLNNLPWTPIGNADMNFNGFYFAGVFDGWYHNIDHLRITSNADASALFAALGGDGNGPGSGDCGTIKHLSVTNGDITATGTGAAGIVAGMADEALVYQCSYSGNITVNNNGSYCGAGGIVGAAMEKSRIVECSFAGSIHVTNNGGFMSAAGAGGIVGVAMDDVCIQSCYNTGSVTASSMLVNVAAGIVAATLEQNNVVVYHCYNVGSLSAMTKGGIFGMVSPINPKAEQSIEVTGCYYLNTCGGNNNYGTSLTADQMRTEGFKDELDGQAHAFVMDNGTNNGYPIHSLAGFRLWEPSDITYQSATLSANIHEGNDSIVRAYFLYAEWDYSGQNDLIEVEVEVADTVSVMLEDLNPATDYVYYFVVQFADSVMMESPQLHFITTEYDAVSTAVSPELLVYPNPATEMVYIQGVDAAEVRLYNATGQWVKTFHDSNVIGVSGFAPGRYLLRVVDRSGAVAVLPVILTDTPILR